jgi:hypothetical protein
VPGVLLEGAGHAGHAVHSVAHETQITGGARLAVALTLLHVFLKDPLVGPALCRRLHLHQLVHVVHLWTQVCSGSLSGPSRMMFSMPLRKRVASQSLYDRGTMAAH